MCVVGFRVWGLWLRENLTTLPSTWNCMWPSLRGEFPKTGDTFLGVAIIFFGKLPYFSGALDVGPCLLGEGSCDLHLDNSESELT